MVTEHLSYAEAPPSVGNMAVGFDVMGHALDAPGDQVRATRTDAPGVTMGKVTGCAPDLPSDPARNTAGAGVLALLNDYPSTFGIRLDVHKRIALGSGMGGSASSAVASVVAANALLDTPLAHEALMPYALIGEEVASGCVHGDNVAPCLTGGIAFICPRDPTHWFTVPVPDGLHCVLVRPELRLDTSAGRSLLADTVTLHDAVTQTSSLGRVMGACFNNAIDELEGALQDVLVEHQRSHQINGFGRIREAALDSGALGFALSGSGPSMVAWVKEQQLAPVRDALTCATAQHAERFQTVVSTVNAPGARRINAADWEGDT